MESEGYFLLIGRVSSSGTAGDVPSAVGGRVPSEVPSDGGCLVRDVRIGRGDVYNFRSGSRLLIIFEHGGEGNTIDREIGISRVPSELTEANAGGIATIEASAANFNVIGALGKGRSAVEFKSK